VRFAAIFAIYGAALAAAAVALRPLGLLLAWPAASCFLIAAAYGLGRPSLLGKRSDGTMAPSATILLAPYLALQHGVWFLAHGLGRSPAMHEVAPGLWLGRRPRGGEVPEHVRTVVDLTAEFHESGVVRAGREYVCLATLDATAPTADALGRVVDGIVASRAPALIHCASGHGRSALVAACVLVARGDVATADEAVARIVAVRTGARLNSAQTAALRGFADRRPPSASEKPPTEDRTQGRQGPRG
jgi:protein-tyrosine phosphatase